ncbi:hypothetical protein [Chamaesiphon polymorphus]|uniref:hypothetical protein n=1 Tax=Chamaesiphon polymorphus TaxID=2107691 RepID=UPI0015E72A4B|nr:hypothetical protein [Chamaesiphon polymorphus]
MRRSLADIEIGRTRSIRYYFWTFPDSILTDSIAIEKLSRHHCSTDRKSGLL